VTLFAFTIDRVFFWGGEFDSTSGDNVVQRVYVLFSGVD
jgi:hypothetical protein